MTEPTKITIETSYTYEAETLIDIGPKTWDDVKEWHIKWDTLFILFEDSEEWKEYPLENNSDGIDWKFPDVSKVYAGKSDGAWDDADKLAVQYGHA
jgi:hypothetical protein